MLEKKVKRGRPSKKRFDGRTDKDLQGISKVR